LFFRSRLNSDFGEMAYGESRPTSRTAAAVLFAREMAGARDERDPETMRRLLAAAAAA
jgi:hypothetical protein